MFVGFKLFSPLFFMYSRRDNRDDQCVESLNGHIVTFSSPTPRTSSSENNNEAAEDQEDDQLVERPNSLKFLAASAAYQESTLPALERLPCTPDPGTLFENCLLFIKLCLKSGLLSLDFCV